MAPLAIHVAVLHLTIHVAVPVAVPMAIPVVWKPALLAQADAKHLLHAFGPIQS